jgi:3-oxoacyl-[acyl-carrier protein] reductase
VALVTGASRGIGKAIALTLADQGAYVVINYRGNQAAAEQTLAALTDGAGSGELLPFDVADEPQVEAAVKNIVDRLKKVDIVVNNAGVTSDSLLMRMKAQDWDQVVGTNLKGTVLCTKAVTRHMVRQRYGRVINISSSSDKGNAGQLIYATKAGITASTRPARELGSRGHCQCRGAGFIDTEMTAVYRPSCKKNFALHLWASQR